MAGKIIGEQFLMIGVVDIPASPENTMKLLASLGSKGYLPSITQEISLIDGRSQNRISLTNTIDVNIGFNSDRIQVIRTPRPDDRPAEIPFPTIVAELCDALKQSFELDIHRVVMVREKMKDERDKSAYDRICKRFLVYGSDENPFEWFTRSSRFLETDTDTLLKVVEVSRAQGFIQQGTAQTPFDAVRTKIEIGTNMMDKSMRFTIDSAAALIDTLHGQLDSSFVHVEEAYRG